MEYMLYVVMLGLLAYVIYRNYKLIGRYRHNKEYIESYKDMLEGKEGTYERVCRYVETETQPEFHNKGLILKLYLELEQGKDYDQSLKELDLRSIFYNNGKFVKQSMNINVDVFIWVYIVMAKARQLSKLDVLNTIYEQFLSMEEDLGNRLEYGLVKAIYASLCEKEDGGVKFLSDLLEGNYSEYAYDRNLIVLYKRMAAAVLAYGGEPLDEFYHNDLRDFAKSAIGKIFMKALEIYERFCQEEKTEDGAQ